MNVAPVGVPPTTKTRIPRSKPKFGALPSVTASPWPSFVRR
jgi:hypothetical protein